MKLIKKIVALIACSALACSLVACQSCTAKNEPTDVEPMEEAGAKDTSPFYVLIVGNDSRTGTVEADKAAYADGTARSDTMMLVRIDPSNYLVTLITVPRDTAVTYNGATVKLNEAYHQGGIDAALDQVQKLTGVKPQYYLDMGFVEFEKFVDELGGVSASVPLDLSLADIVSGESIVLSPGEQDLNGAEALVLARCRKQYADFQDACRQIQDRQLVQVAIGQVAADPVNAAAHAQTLLGHTKTNWSAEDLTELVADFAKNADKLKIVSGTGPYAGALDETTQLWLTTRDEETWKEVISVVDQGGDPTTIVPLPQVAPA